MRIAIGRYLSRDLSFVLQTSHQKNEPTDGSCAVA
jgi:hypothetical protein